MKFGIYCADNTSAGAKSVALGLLRYVPSAGPQHQFMAYVPALPEFEQLANAIDVKVIRGAGGVNSYRLLQGMMPTFESDGLDAVLLLGNMRTKNGSVPQAVLMHNPWYAYPDSIAWRRLSLKDWLYRRIRNRIFHHAMTTVEVVVTQTEAMRQAVAKRAGRSPSEIQILPNSITSTKDCAEAPSPGNVYRHANPFLVLSRYYPHKNIEVLPRVAERLHYMGRKDIGIYTTLAPEHGPGAARLISLFEQEPYRDHIVNIGVQAMEVVPSLYAGAAGLLLPSLLESYTSTYADAAHYGVPIITSDFPWSKELCPPGTLFCGPEDSEAIAVAMASVADNEGLVAEYKRSAKDFLNSSHMNWETIAERAVTILETAARTRGPR
jgi:glycosyltransferase involved in cell wall biosynthesis